MRVRFLLGALLLLAIQPTKVIKFCMVERDQESLIKKVQHFILNLHVRDGKARRSYVEHIRAGMTPPHVEAMQDVVKLQQSWEWIESFDDGGLKVRINGKEFYARFQTNGALEQLTLWDNYFPEQ